MKMKLYRSFAIFFIVALLLPTGGRTAQAQSVTANVTSSANLPDYVPGELLVRFQKGVAPRVVDQQVQVGAAALDGLLQQYGVTAAEKIFSTAISSNTGMDRIYKLSFSPDADMLSLLSALSADRAIEFAEPNYLYYTQQTTDVPPSDRLYGYQWGLYNPRSASADARIDIHTPEAWKITTGDANLLIAVIDTGIDYTHEDLSDGRVRTDIDKDYVNRDDDAMDDQGHGTHVAGTIAAATNNAVGGAGVMWQAQLLPLKVCSGDGGCSTEHIVQAIEYAADNGARVINMSLGGDSCSQTLEAAIDYAYFEKGVVIVAAAGNSNDLVGYPAAYEPVIAVGAVDRHGNRAFFSSYGDPLDVVAPGVRIFSSVLNNSYDTFSGTSMATPHVTGVAGLLLSQRPELTNTQVRALLEQSATDLGENGLDRQFGYGLVNAQAALEMATPADAVAPGPSRCIEIECGAAAALSGEPDEWQQLTTLRAVRDEVFARHPNIAWTDIYYRHQAEVFWLVMSDSTLRDNARSAIRTLNPALTALLRGQESGDVQITAAMVQQADVVINALMAQGSSSLRRDLQAEWQRLDAQRFVGSSVHDAWQQVAGEGQTIEFYLPVAAQ